MLTRWLLIDATRAGSLVVYFRGGFELLVFEGGAELLYSSRLVAVLPVGRA